MGEGIEELNLVKWLKKPGDRVKELEAIVEVETDKVVTELPSPASGVVLEVLAEEGKPVRVGDVLAWIGAAGEEIPSGKVLADAKTKTKEKKITHKKVEPITAAGPVKQEDFLSPVVRRMVAEHGLDVRKLTGTGKNRRVTKRDVLEYLHAHGSDAEEAPVKVKAAAGERSSEALPISSIRRTIANRMIDSLRTSAHVLTVMEADLSRVAAHRAPNKPLYQQDGVRLTLTAYFIQAVVAGLKANPKVNSSWTDEGLEIHPYINIGMAVSLGEQGLIVPVIKQADTLSLLGIARQVNDLAERARKKQLQSQEVQGGTFSLTNHGMSGSLFATPIITQPQVGILGTGMVQKRAVVVTDAEGNDAITIRPMVYLSFVFDHRVLDGEGADAFLAVVVQTLENWQ